MRFQLQAKGAMELAGLASICQQDKWLKQQGQYLENQDEKPPISNQQVLMGQQQHLQHPQNPNFSLPLPQEQHLRQPLPKRLNPGNLEFSSQIPKFPFADPRHELFTRKQQQQQHMGIPQGVQVVPQQKPLIV